MKSHRCLLLFFVFVMVSPFTDTRAKDQPKKPDSEKPKVDKNKPQPIAGKAELLRQIPKKYATLQSVDPARHEVTLLLEGDTEPKTWTINPDAEMKVHGWWGRLDQFEKGDRLWVWFDIDRKKQPRSILMLADEISQQDIGIAPTLEAVDAEKQSITLKPLKGNKRDLALDSSFRIRLEKEGDKQRVIPVQDRDSDLMKTLKIGDKVFVQTAGGVVRLMIDAAGLEKLRDRQRLALRERWIKEGLPATVSWLHALSGEMELMLDHEAIRWSRNLKAGDRVTIKVGEKIAADVKEIRPWRERTVLRLVVGGFDQAELKLGQRVQLEVSAPPLAVDTAELPPDIDRPRSKPERVEWFLASTYCTCKVGGDGCTGMFYTLSSCNVNACGMPNNIREKVAELIDQGKTDKQIWEDLRKSQGPLMLKPHLLP